MERRIAQGPVTTADEDSADREPSSGNSTVWTGLLIFGWPRPEPEPALRGWRAAVVPIAFPTLLTPGLALLAVVGSADELDRAVRSPDRAEASANRWVVAGHRGAVVVGHQHRDRRARLGQPVGVDEVDAAKQ